MQRENESPAFLFEAARFLVDTLGWTNEQVGLHIRLLAMHWVNKEIEPEDKMVKNCSFFETEVWEEIKHKYTNLPNGNFFNERLEKDRDRVLQNKNKYHKRALDAAETRWGRKTEQAQPAPLQPSQPYIQSEPVSQSYTAPFERQLSYVTKEVIIAGDKMVLDYYDDGGHNCKQLDMWLTGNDMRMAVAQSGLESMDREFLKFVIIDFIKSTILSDDIALKKISMSFKNFHTYKLETLQKLFNKLKQNLTSFKKGVDALAGDEKIKQDFFEYYTRLMPAGNLYFQQLQNPNVKSLWLSWLDNNSKNKTLKHEAKVLGVVLPAGDAKMEDIVDHYKKV